jgi:hypothetical protein
MLKAFLAHMALLGAWINLQISRPDVVYYIDLFYHDCVASTNDQRRNLLFVVSPQEW